MVLPNTSVFQFYEGTDPAHYTDLTGVNLNAAAKALLANDKAIQSAMDNLEKEITNSSTDLKKLGEEYKALLGSKLKEVDSAIAKAKSEIKAFDYAETSKPTVKTNPPKKYATWLDLTSGTIWVCVDNTKDKNKWVSGGKNITTTSFNAFDIFGDGSSIAYLPLKRNFNDLGGRWNTRKNGSHSASFSGSYYEGNDYIGFTFSRTMTLPNSYTISYQLNWNGLSNDLRGFAHSSNPNTYIIQHHTHTNWAVCGSSTNFRVNTIGANRWFTVVLIKQGTNAQLFINGIRYFNGTVLVNNRYVQQVMGNWNDGAEAWSGKMRNIRFFNRALTTNEIKRLGEEQ